MDEKICVICGHIVPDKRREYLKRKNMPEDTCCPMCEEVKRERLKEAS